MQRRNQKTNKKSYSKTEDAAAFNIGDEDHEVEKKNEIVPFKLAPSYLKFNPYITDGYRNKLSIYNCFKSMFWWTNETLNIWSHLFGLALFVGLFIYDFAMVYGKYKASSLDVIMAAFVLICFMACMLLSSLYHCLNCHSNKYCQLWLSWDIFGVSAAFLAVFVSGIYYAFWCNEHLHLRNMYIGLVFVLFSTAMIFLLVPSFTGDEWSWVRLTLFCIWSLSGLFPTFHWLTLFGGMQSSIVKVFIPRIFTMYAISLTALIVYVFRIPESILPGRFNYVGASHQLWHVITVCALLYWHQSGLEYAKYREKFGCSLTI